MHDLRAWSVSLGRWGGMQVRLHALFFAFAILVLYLCSQLGGDMPWHGLTILVVLFISVLLHERAHGFAALRVGGRCDEIILGPLGGMTWPSVPRQPPAELRVALAGPLTNLVIAVACVPLLLISDAGNVTGLLNPLFPLSLVEGRPPVVVLKLVFWINWTLLLVNLLPAFPFDGGRVLRALLWPLLGYRHALIAVGRVALLAAASLGVLALLMHDSFPTAPVKPWVPLALIGVLLLFSSRHELARLDKPEMGDELFGYDFSQGYTSLEEEGPDEPESRREPGLLMQWFERRREARHREQRAQEVAEEARVDEILARLHETGLEGLSPQDRALLERVSHRYRNRLEG